MSYLLHICLLVLSGSQHGETEDLLSRVREDQGAYLSQDVVFKAEVHGMYEEGERTLVSLLSRLEPSESKLRTKLVKALAMVRRAEIQDRIRESRERAGETGAGEGGKPYEGPEITVEAFSRPDALYLGPDRKQVIVNNERLEPGDWLKEDYFMTGIHRSGASLENLSGDHRTITWNDSGSEKSKVHGLLLWDADVVDVLRFATGKAGLQMYVTPERQGSPLTPLNGFFEANGWMDLIALLCEAGGLTWTRNKGTLFLQKRVDTGQHRGFLIRRVSLKDGDVKGLVDFITTGVGLAWEDPDGLLDGQKISIEVSDQPWDAVLDSIARACNIRWELVRDNEGNPNKLLAAR